MNDLLSRPDYLPAAPAQPPLSGRSRVRLLGLVFSTFTGLIILLALGSGALLLLKDTSWSLLQHMAHAPISALPLLLIGLASLCFQIVIRPTLLDLFKAAIVSTAFLLWGIDQLLPMGWEATTLGDIVIVLYVIDLGWMMGDRLKEQSWNKPMPQETQPLPLQPVCPLHLLPSSHCARLSQPLPLSDLPLWQQETQPVSPRLLKEPTSSSSVLKRYRLLPLRGTERR
jgi:hypothetical protein